MTYILFILFLLFIIASYIKMRQIEDRLYILQKFTLENSTQLSNIRYSYNEIMKNEIIKYEENKNNNLHQ